MGLSYEKTGDVIEITVRDATMRKTGSWKFNTADTDLASGIFAHLQRKYGFSPEIKPKENVKSKPQSKEPDWLNMDVKW